MHDDITLCMTIGGRPDLLRETLRSMAALPRMPTLAINDFADTETSDVFRTGCPHGRLIDAGCHLGHHGAVDRMYAEVRTSYIFHSEDDWAFTRHDFLGDALFLLEFDPSISSVCFRSVEDIPLPNVNKKPIQTETIAGISFSRLDPLHDEWYGFTFNPHLARRSLWDGLGGFSRFKKERHISRALRAQGCHVAFLIPGACHHIGGGKSNNPTYNSAFRRLKKWLRSRRNVE